MSDSTTEPKDSATEAKQAERDQQEADALRNALARQFVFTQHRRFDGTTWGEL